MVQPFDLAWLTPDQQRAWRLLLVVMAQLPSDLNRQLQADAGLGFRDFDVLVHLSESPGHRLRLGELADAMGWERSRTSHHVARMATRGLVRRQRVHGDGRGAWVVATDDGLAAHVGAAEGHVARVRELLFTGVGEDDAAHLGRLLERVVVNLGRQPAPTWHSDPTPADAEHPMIPQEEHR